VAQNIQNAHRVLKSFLLVCAQPEWIRMFSPDELQMLISGSTLPVDLADLLSY